MPQLSIQYGYAPQDAAQAATLYWQAFGGKLGKIMSPDAKAIEFFQQTLDPAFSLTAYDADGHLLGIAGYKTSKGAFAGGGFADLARVYGTIGALWRTGTLMLLDRDIVTDTLLMDGIFVAPDAQGQGVGTALLHALKHLASEKGVSILRLDVINNNPRARALYDREGFVATKTTHLGPLRYIFGFSKSTAMEFDVTRWGKHGIGCRNAAN